MNNLLNQLRSFLQPNRMSRRLHGVSVNSAELLEARQMLSATSAGRGQDLLLIVDPGDENSLRVAGEYQQLRSIPDNNILFVEAPSFEGFARTSLTTEEFWADYVATVHNAIHDRGLHDQIDFIAAIGQPQAYNDYDATGSYFQSLSFGLSQLDQYFAGMTVRDAQQQGFGPARLQQSRALHHSDRYENVTGSTTGTHQYYVAGLLGNPGQLGNSADQIIAGLRRSVAADGTKPEGTIYFEENDNVRSDAREWQWDAVQAELTARGIQFIEESNVAGGTPQNRDNVRGAVVGDAEAVLPNGSTFLPGSWADNLTSFGGNHESRNQTKATDFIAAGAAASSGTVAEPGGSVTPLTHRFPHAEIFTHIDNGLTLGEAFYQSVVDPDMIQFIGDILAQPYADIPNVTITGAADNEVIAGTSTLSASATVPAGGLATAVTRLDLYIDGRFQESRSGNAAQFSLNTLDLPDGLHELRIVAVANNAAESEGIGVLNVRVNNTGRSIATTANRHAGVEQETINVPVAVTAGNGMVERVELRHLGRVVGTGFGAATSVALNLSSLAYGDNRVIPVAIFADGTEVRGPAFVANREPNVISGGEVPAAANRTPGIRAEYFLADGAASIAGSNFSGTPDIDTRHEATDLFHNAHGQTYATAQIDGLAVRLTGSFTIDAAATGEYLFTALNSNDSVQIRVDGRDVLSYDDLAYGLFRTDGSASVFLGEGRHDFEILQANTGTEDGMRLEVLVRGPDSVTKALNDEFVYTYDDTAATLAPPTITAPTGTVDVRRPLMTWTAVDGAVDYQVRVLDTTDSTIVVDAVAATRSFTAAVDLPDGSYRVEVRARSADAVSAWASLPFTVQANRSAGNRIVVLNSSFEEGALEDVFDSLYADGTTYRVTDTDSHGTGSRALEITYSDDRDEIEMKAEVDLLQRSGLSSAEVQSVEVSFSSRLPDGLPIDGVTRGWGGLKQSRAYNSIGIEGFNGIGDQLTKTNSGSYDGVNPLTDEWTWANIAGSHDKSSSVTLDPTEWYTVRYFARRNTPEEADGVFMFWLNDQLIEHSTDVTWPESPNGWVDGVWFGGNLSLGGETADHPFRRLIDNVFVAVNGEVPDVGSGTATTEFFEDFEGLDQTCWDEHLTSESGFSHLIQDDMCGDFIAIGEGDNIRLIETADARSGTHALQVTYEQNEDRGQAVVPIYEGTEYIQTSQYMRFNETYDFGYGQKIHRIYSVDAEENRNFDIVVLAWGQPLDGRADTDLSGVNGTRYLSINYNGSNNPELDWGGAWNLNFSFERERWYKITSEIQLNNVGQSDGWVRLFVDDILVAEEYDLRIRDSADQQINRVLYGGWYSNGGAGLNPEVNAASPTSLLIDDVSFITNPGAALPQIVVAETQGTLRVTEAGTTDSFTLSLSAAPAQNVVLQVGGGDGEVEASVQTLTFTPANWNVPQTVTVTAIDDDVVEGEQQVSLTISVDANSDPAWTSVRQQTVNVTIVDNDQRQDAEGWQDGILVLPGDATQNYRLNFDWTERRGEYDNELGFFVVDDLQGRISGLLPTDAGYAQAALRSASRRTIFASGQTQGAESTNHLPGGSLVVFYMVQNASTSQFLMDNPGNDAAATPIVFYSLPEANIDNFDHVRVTEPESNVWQFGWEDLLNGGDQSFTDAVIRLSVTESDAGTANGYRQVVKSDSNQKSVTDGGIIEIPVVYQTLGPNGQPAALRSNVISFNLHFDKDVLEFIDTINVLQEGLLVAPDTVRAETDPVVAGSDDDTQTDSVLTASYSDNDGLTFPGWPNAPDAQGQVVFVARFRARPGLNQTSIHFTPNAVGTVTGERAEFEFAAQSVTVSVSETSGDVDGDGDFDANDTFLIHTVMLSGSDQQVTQSLGASPLDAAQIRSNILSLDAAGDIDGDNDFDANDSFLLHLIKLSGSDAQIDLSKGASPLTAVQIRQNAAKLEGNLLQSISTPAIGRQPRSGVDASFDAFSLQNASDTRRQTRVIKEEVDRGATALVMSDELTESEISTAWEGFREWLDRI